MPHGSAVYDYKIVRRKNEDHAVIGHTVGDSHRPAIGARSFLYLGGPVAPDEEIIDRPICTKGRTYEGDPIWLQEPGGQILSNEQVDEIIATGATVREGS
jgi:hypothetical protein